MFTYNRILFIPVAFLFAAISTYYGFTYIGYGVLIGLALPIYFWVRGESTPSFGLGVCLLLLSVIGFGFSIYISSKYGLTFEEIANAQQLNKYEQRMPYYSVVSMCAGLVIIFFQLLFVAFHTKPQNFR